MNIDILFIGQMLVHQSISARAFPLESELLDIGSMLVQNQCNIGAILVHQNKKEQILRHYLLVKF